MDQFDLRRLAEPYMLTLRDLTGQTVVLSIPASGDAMVSAAWEFPNPVMISVTLGYRLPAHASAQGRLTLAFSPLELQSRVLSRKLAGLHAAHDDRSGKAARAPRGRCASSFTKSSMDETLLGISAVAAPILNFDNELVGVDRGGRHHATRARPGRAAATSESARLRKAISLKLNSTAYEGLGVPNLREFIFD